MDVNLQSLYQIQMDHLLNRFQHHPKTKMKGFVEFLYLTLLSFLIYIFIKYFIIYKIIECYNLNTHIIVCINILIVVCITHINTIIIVCIRVL